jgi:UDP-glucose 4-epimerase
MTAILVTGRVRYIGSHTCLQLLEQGDQVIVLDNLSNSFMEALHRVQHLANKSLTFVEGDFAILTYCQKSLSNIKLMQSFILQV